MAKGYTPFRGFDPRVEGEAEFRLIMSELDLISRYKQESKLLDLYCVREICENPARGYVGLRTVDDTFGDPREFIQVPDPGGLCLTGIPSRRLISNDPRRLGDPVEGHTFAVFLDDALVVRDWDWIVSDREDPQAPIGWQERFSKQIWSRD